MKYIVTGGAGFIGSHLVEALLERGCEVVVIDDFSAGLRQNLPKNEKLRVLRQDIAKGMELLSLQSYLEGAQGVFHLAANARIQPSILNPCHTWSANAQGTFNILEAMRHFHIPAIVYSASSSVYGLREEGPLIEVLEPRCLTPYSVTKYMGEELCKTWSRCYGIKCVSLRYFNVYGPRSPVHIGSYSPVIGLFFKQAFDNKPLTVVGDGKQKRDFTYVSDVVRANIMAMLELQTTNGESNAECESINIGTGENYTIKEVAAMVKATMADIRPDLYIEHVEARPGEARTTLADISTAKELLGWGPRITLLDAMPKLKAYYSSIWS